MHIHAAIPQVAQHPGIRLRMLVVPFTGHFKKVGQVVDRFGGFGSL